MSEVIVDSESDSLGTFFILFNHPRLVRPRRPRQVQQAASTLTGNTAISLVASSSSSSAATSSASSGAASSTQSRAMQGFVYGRNMSGIRSPAHGSALIGILQIAGAHKNGILGSLGHGHRTAWITHNRSAFFRVGGPLAVYNELSATVLMRHLADAESEARAIFDRSHSNDPTGAEQEDVSRWAQHFFHLFEAQDSHLSALTIANEVRRERGNVVRSIVGAQAPLGQRQRDGVAHLRNETSTRSTGTAQQRQRSVGNVEHVHRMNEGEMNNYLAEGADDVSNPRPAQCGCTAPRDGRTRRIVDFSVDRNDPVSQFADIQYGFQSVGMLSNAVRQNMNAPLPEPWRTGRDVANDYEHASAQYHNAVISGDEMDIQFWNAHHINLCAELAVIESSSVNSNEVRNNE